MNKSDKAYLINQLFVNFINESGKMQYRMNMQILHIFRHLDYIQHDVYNRTAPMVHNAAYNDSFYDISKAQELLCKEMGVPIKE